MTLYYAVFVCVGLIAALTRNRRVMGYAGIVITLGLVASLFIGG